VTRAELPDWPRLMGEELAAAYVSLSATTLSVAEGVAVMPLRVLSLFAGIGGFDLGLERTGGFKTVAVAETDTYGSKVLAKRFPDAPNLGDVTTAEYPDADIICAGFPCQDISYAGEGAGLAGARSGLWREVVRAVRVVGPRFTILENVAALLNRGMGTVLGDLAEVGHDAEWHCIPAAAVGAPHIRDRVWIVAEPQHPDAYRTGSYRAEEHDGRSERSNKQGRVVGSVGAFLADAAGLGQRQGDANRRRRGERGGQKQGAGPWSGSWWSVEPNVGRVAHGVPKRVDRLRCLGNAVVPQIPEMIGRAILASMKDAA
jgi:DNA (cytosine-5)-methyltransferase 1